MILTRRTALAGLAAGTVLTRISPTLAVAGADTDRRFVFIFLRGGMDGLSAVQAYGDPNFAKARAVLADDPPGTGGPFECHKLDGLFALNPYLPTLAELYDKGEMLAVHAVHSPYRERSHFDAQDILENGTDGKAERSGFLNRALANMPAAYRDGRKDVGLGLGPVLPYSLRGPQAVGSWSPPSLPSADADTLARIGDLYAEDPVLSIALAKAEVANSMAQGMSMDDMMGGDGAGPAVAFTQMTKVAVRFLQPADGARIVTIDYGNWDSHANQNERDLDPNSAFAGRFPEMYKGLDSGITHLREGLGPEVWAKTVVAIVTEFGRTIEINGTNGTDHGTAGALLLAGGSVNGGRVVADWPGLRVQDRHEERDLRPTTDVRSVLKGVLGEHLGISEAALEDAVFPQSRAAKPISGLIRV